MTARLDPEREARFWAAAERAGQFFMGTAPLHLALRKITKDLDGEHIPYAIAGALALGEYGYERATNDVDVLLTREGLERFKARYLGRGYVEKFAGSKGLRDTENNVTIDVLITGEFPGDGKPKPVAFPDPALVAERSNDMALLPVAKLVELKLASGISAPHRLRDLGDVLELIRAAKLPLALAEELDPYVREKYRELWSAAASAPPDE